MGAESIRDLLRDLDLDLGPRRSATRSRRRRGKAAALDQAPEGPLGVHPLARTRPEWMILEAVPVIRRELRPMVQLEGGASPRRT